ncbi:winged helix-turn-helix transcriptional regulator [Bacillus sp. 1P06AnD]|uniref:winged helix-turn-helix transcriptional regulator n=1 Tax=Bacillus sp. 1P06AnD TaxID=3132208 RepID=UPI0039A34064
MGEEDKTERLCKKKEQSFHIIGRKWVGSIIHTLMDKPKRFTEIHEYIPDLSKKVLIERIKELEEFKIVERRVISERPVRTEYSLTKKGWELGIALRSIEEWADRWL